MTSDLSTIGFVFKNNEEFAAKMVELADTTDAQAIFNAGHYSIWSEPSGVQLWFHIEQELPVANGSGHADADAPRELSILGLTPFFEGSSSVPVNITGVVNRDYDNLFEGGFYAWVAPDDSGGGAYPLVFDAVDFAMHTRREVPFSVNVRLSGFAYELCAHASRESYDKTESDRPKLATKAFVPVGLFPAAANDADNDNDAGGANDGANGGERDDEENNTISLDEVSSRALLTGIVSAHRILKNESTGRDFHWLSVESYEASFDIIAAPDVVTGEIVKGGLVEVACYFYGRILD